MTDMKELGTPSLACTTRNSLDPSCVNLSKWGSKREQARVVGSSVTVVGVQLMILEFCAGGCKMKTGVCTLQNTALRAP